MAHRRDALWQTQRAILPVGPLLAPLEEIGQPSPLAPMNTGERLFADYQGTGLTIGKHPMAYRRAEMDKLRVTRAADLARVPNGRMVRIAGSVIVRQRPGTAKGFVFLSMEDETGIMNAILTPPTFDRFKFTVLGETFPADRWRAAESRRSGLRESRARRRHCRGRRRGLARFPLS